MIDQHQAKLGTLERVYRVRRQSGWLFFVIAALAAGAMIFLLVHFANAPLCASVPLGVFAWVTVEFFIKRRTELKVFEHGLVYQRLFKEHTVFWNDLEEFGHILREDYETADLRDERGEPVPNARSIRSGGDHVWLQTFSGEKINLRPDLENIKEIIDTISVRLWGEPYYSPDPDEVYTSRIIKRKDIDA